MKILKGVTTVLVALLVLAMAFMLLGPRFGWRVDTVLSGSMEPVFGAGDAVVIRNIDPTKVNVGDIITFRNPGNESVIVSHRVVQVEQGSQPIFSTKGDANEEADNYKVSSDNLTGLVTLSLPLVGYFAGFAKTRMGLVLLLIVPGLLVILNEMRRIWVTLSAMEKQRQSSPSTQG